MYAEQVAAVKSQIPVVTDKPESFEQNPGGGLLKVIHRAEMIPPLSFLL